MNPSGQIVHWNISRIISVILRLITLISFTLIPKRYLTGLCFFSLCSKLKPIYKLSYIKSIIYLQSTTKKKLKQNSNKLYLTENISYSPV